MGGYRGGAGDGNFEYTGQGYAETDNLEVYGGAIFV